MTPLRASLPTLRWIGREDGHLLLIDQTRLPRELCEVSCRDLPSVWQAIRTLQVRGAPAIGIAAAYGACLGLQTAADNARAQRARLDEVCDYLASSRPTAVNLRWALERVRRAARQCATPDIRAAVLREAQTIHQQDRAACHAIGRHGAALLGDVQAVLTHCNAGGLATSEYGTALSIVFTAQDQGRALHVFVGETRPLLQGARLTAWELAQRGIRTTLLCDSMAAQVMREGRVQAVVTGADRIAANGDAANKIGTYGLAVLAQAHDIPVYVAAPRSTFDLDLADGRGIPIEQRAPDEVTHLGDQPIAPAGIEVYNPAFDVTPARLIRAIVTELGVIQPVDAAQIRAVLARTDTCT